nr:ATP-binding protein [uncultured Schaedlerella sp.]
MEKFIGRKNELDALEKLYNTPGFQMTVIYGRRRIGKSTLIKEFIKEKKAVFFTATRAGIHRNLELLGKQALEVLAPAVGALAFENMDALFSFIGDSCQEERTIIVIDEFPYLAEADGSILSVLQNYIDNQWLNGQMDLILCGSSVSFMENEVLSEKSPLFGRRTSQIKLEPFQYLDAAEFVPGYSREEQAICYGVTGGVAKYLSLFDDSKSLDENIITQFFTKSGYLYEETNNLLTQEFRNVSSYSDIIEAISSGANRLNEISDKTHIAQTAVSHALSNLITTGIVVRETAATDEKNKKKVQYNLKDNMFRFWYKYVPNGIGAIELDKGELYYQNAVKPRIAEYMGNVFEEMCRFYTLHSGIMGRLNCYVTTVGKWWGTNPGKRMQTDIDIVGLDKMSKKAVLGECKFKNEPVDKKIYEDLMDRNGLISREYMIVQYLLFSKSGFSEWVRENTDPSLVKKITLQEMYCIENT